MIRLFYKGPLQGRETFPPKTPSGQIHLSAALLGVSVHSLGAGRPVAHHRWERGGGGGGENVDKDFRTVGR